MYLSLKILGMIMFVASTSAIGIFKSLQCKNRVKSLEKICMGLDTLKDRVSYCGGESEKLLRECFPDFEALTGSLDGGERKLFSQFLSDFGGGLAESEAERITMYRRLFEKRKEVSAEYAEKTCKLYKTVGFCFGIAGCIFLF